MPQASTARGGASHPNPFRTFDLRTLIDTKLKKIGAWPKKFVRIDRPRDRIYASDLGKCPRAVWLGWRHPRPHDDEFERKRGALGHAVEDMIAKVQDVLIVAREVSFVDERVSGRADFVLRIDNEQVPEEVKSTYAFDRFLADPPRTNVLQAAWYAMQLGAPFALLTYVNLANYGGNSGDWNSLVIPRMDDELKREAEMLWQVVHTDKMPLCGNPKDCFDCSLFEHEGA